MTEEDNSPSLPENGPTADERPAHYLGDFDAFEGPRFTTHALVDAAAGEMAARSLGSEIADVFSEGRRKVRGWLGLPPDGEDTSPIEILNPLAGIAAEYGVKTATEGGLGEGSKAIARGFFGAKANVGSGIEQYGKTIGNDGVAEFGARMAAEGKDIAENKFTRPSVETFRDIRREAWISDGAKYLESKLGEGVGNIASIAALYQVGGAAGAAGLLATMSIGEVRDGLKDAGLTDEAQIAPYAYGAGLVVAALESVFPKHVLKELTAPAKQALASHVARTFIKGAWGGTWREGLTEGLQEATQIAAVAHAKDAVALFDAKPVIEALSAGENIDRVIEAVISGAVPGGAIGGVTSGARGRGAARDQSTRGTPADVGQPVARDVSPSLDPNVAPGKGPTVQLRQPDPALDEARAVLDAVSPSQTAGTPAATAPTLAQIVEALPKDEWGDPDIRLLVERVTELGATAWSNLTPEQKTEVYQRFAPVVAAAVAAPAAVVAPPSAGRDLRPSIAVPRDEAEPVPGARKPTPQGIATAAAADIETGAGAAALNAVIQKLKDSLGVVPTQTLLGLTVRAEDGSEVRLNPRANVRGQTQSATAAVGVRKSRALDVIAHEMAHTLEVTMPNVVALQQKHAATLQAFAPGSSLSEAWADWFSHYIRSAPHAQAATGDLFRDLEGMLGSANPAMLAGIREAQALYQDWLSRASPEALASDVVSTYAGNSWSELAEGDKALSQTIPGKLAGAYTAVIDDLSPIQQMTRRLLQVADRNGVKDQAGRPISLAVAENPYKIARMFRGSYATGYSWLKNGIANRGETTVSYPGLAKALETALGSASRAAWKSETYQAFGQYLISRRAIAEYDRLEQKAARLAEIEKLAERGEAARQSLTPVRQRLSDTLQRREDARLRSTALRTDRKTKLRAAEAELVRLQERLQAKKDDVLAAQMARDEALTKRRQRDLAFLERDSRTAIARAQAEFEEYESADIDVSLLGAEIEQLEAQLSDTDSRIASLEKASASLKAERERTEKLGASRPPTRESKDWHQDYIAKADAAHPQFSAAASIATDFAFGLLSIRHQAGLISDEQFAELATRRDWYVPFQRDMSDAAPEAVFGKGGRAWSPFKKFDGSDRAIINPLETLAADAYATAQHIAFNDATAALAALAERAGPGGASIAHVLTREEAAEANAATFDRIKDIALAMGIDQADATRLVQNMEQNFANQELSLIWSPATQGPVNLPTVPLWRNGERTMVRLTDPELGREVFNAMSGLGKELSDWALNFAATPARLLQMGITTHPTFMPRNLFRDIFDAWIKTGALPIAAQIEGVKRMRDPDFMRRYHEAGGIVGGRNVAALTAKEQQVKVDGLLEGSSRGSIVLGAIGGGLLGTIYGGPIGGAVGAVVGGVGMQQAGARAGVDILKIVEGVETMTRLGVASRAYKRALTHNPNLSESEAMLEAAFVARDVFDWNRRGSKMLPLVRSVVFLNAQVQGLDAMVRRLGGESDRGATLSKQLGIVWRRETGGTLSADEERQLGDAYKTWARWGVYNISLLGLLALATSGNDDDDKAYQDIRDSTKSTHSWLPSVFGVDIRLPKAFEWAMPANVIEAIADKIRGRDPRAWSRIVDSTYEVMAPPLVPQAATLIVGLTTNAQLENLAPWVKRLLGRDPENASNRQIIGDQLARLDPESQFDAFTTQLSIDIAKAMTAAGVPRDLVPSPRKVDFVLRSGGYWGQDIARGYGIVREALGGRPREAPRVSDIPVIAGFTGVAARQSKSRDELFQLMSQSGGQLATAAATYKQLIDEEGSPADAERLLSRLEPEERAYAILKYYAPPSEVKSHPLERLLAVDRTLSKIRKDMILDRLTPVRKEGRKTVRDFDAKISLSARKQAEAHEIIERLQQAEAWNSMIVMGRPGWQGKTEIAVKPILDELRASSPAVFELYEDRLQAARVHDFADVKSDWPELRARILERGRDAF